MPLFSALDFESAASDQEQEEVEDPLGSVKENQGAKAKEVLANAAENDRANSASSKVLAAVHEPNLNGAEAKVGGGDGQRTPTGRKKLMKQIKDLKSQMTTSNLAKLPSDQLLDVHQHLNDMMTQVVIALKSKCPVTPQNSQSSQSEDEASQL